MSGSYLSRIERGERGLDSLALRRIAAELRVPMDRFFVPSSYEAVHARSGEGWAGAMRHMIEWGRKVQDDLDFCPAGGKEACRLSPRGCRARGRHGRSDTSWA